MLTRRRVCVLVVAGIAASLLSACGAPPFTPTPTAPATQTATATTATEIALEASPSPPPTDTATATATATAPTRTPTQTRTPAPTDTSTPTPTATPAVSDTPAPSPTGTRESSPTENEALLASETVTVLLEENFDDEIADGWQVEGGAWGIRERQYDQSSLGGPYWSYYNALTPTDYGAQAAFRLLPEVYDDTNRRIAGIAARMSDVNNFCFAALDWLENRVIVYQVVNNEWETLASRSLPLWADTWYTLRIVTRGAFLRAYVDGALQLEANCSRHTQGFTGIRLNGGHFRIDNVRIEAVTPLTMPATLPFVDDFNRGNSDGWWKQNGAWRVRDGALEQTYTGAGEVWAYMPELTFADYQVEARIQPLPIESGEEVRPPGGTVGLMLRMTGLSNGYWGAIDLEERDVQILVRQGGAWTLLGNRPLDEAIDLTAWHTLAFEATGAELRLYLDGEVVVQATDRTHPAGQLGIMTNRGHFFIDDILVTDTTPPPTPEGAPPGALPYVDEFEDGFADGWEFTGGGWVVEDGALDQAQFFDGSEALAWVNLPGRNYAITADVRLVPEAYQDEHGRWVGLLIRYQNPRRGYWGVVNVRRGEAQIWQGDGQSWRALTAPTPVEFDIEGWNTLRIEAFEDQLRFRVNGELIVQATNSAWQEGSFGVRILEGHFEVDNLLVEEIDR